MSSPVPDTSPPIEILAPSLPEEAVEAFRTDVRLIEGVYEHLREGRDLPGSAVRLVLADDFVGEVERHMREPSRRDEGGSFSIERVGGVVAAKNLPQADDYSDIVIVFNAALWTHAAQPEIRLTVANLVAHELVHPIIERARHVSGVMDGVLIPSFTGLEVAASMARIMVGEYRADRIADEVVSSFITANVNGEVVAAYQWLTSSDSWTSTVEQVAAAAHPRWPDTVQDYREGRTDLVTMYGRLVPSIDQTMTTIVHSQAGADSAETGLDVLAEEPIASLPATRLYLGDTWASFLEAMRTGPLLADLAEFRAWDEAATAVGRDAILEIWRRLGLTVEEHDDRQWALWVDEPLR